MNQNKTIEPIKRLLTESIPYNPPLHLKPEFDGQTILITGAAGSVGRELTKQLLFFNYEKLILIDIAESPLYNLQQEINGKDSKRIDFLIANVCDRVKMNSIFEFYKPTVVFHTAAYKHVPLMENNPYEALKLNVFGTKVLADVAIKNDVKKFIFISTDKAVNPINIMGSTKRIAELYIQFLTEQDKATRFYITRFGNILSSNGSVIPLFKKQIKMGGPITVTHPMARRYFISLSKASGLILETVGLTTNTITFTFNMKEPVKIIDVAQALISLSNKSSENINIDIIGLRKGEKLTEDLISNNEKLLPSTHEDIMQVISEVSAINDIESKLTDLSKLTPEDSIAKVSDKIKAFLQSL